MTPRARLIVNILAWFAFLAIAPFLISYSMGHRITTNSANPVSVGTFLLRTVPNGAEVFLNEKLLGNKTPSSIQNLLPGQYNLRVEKDGYRQWNKKLPITGTLITDIRDVRLIPAVIEEDVMRTDIINFSISPKRQWLGLIDKTKNGNQLKIVSFNKYADPGINVKVLINSKETVNFLWSPNEDYLILQLSMNKTSRNYLVEINNGNSTELVNDGSKIMGWVSTLTDEKLVKLKSNKTIISPLKGTGTETISLKTEAISFNTNSFAILEKNDEKYNIRTFSLSGNEQDQISVPSLAKFPINDIFLSSSGDIAILVQPTQKLMIWDNTDHSWHEITEHADNINWSPEGDKISWQESEFDLWIMNLHEKRTLLNPFVPELIARLSSPIRKPAWYAGSHQILFFEKDTLKIAELDPRNGHIIESLISTNISDSKAEVIQNGDEIIATVSHENVPALSRFFMLEKADR
jgi:hypothetical protein